MDFNVQSMKYFFITILSFLFISCSKNNTSDTQPANDAKDSTCQITAVKMVSATDSFTTVLFYNSAGKLIKTNDDAGTISLYTYDGNRIFKSYSNVLPMIDTTTVNNFGYITTFVHNTNSFILSNSFFYTSDTVLSYSVIRSPLITSPPDTTTYHFTDGDLTSFVTNGITYNYTYYPDKSEQPGDFSIYYQMSQQSALAYSNKHLTKSYSGNSFSEEYTYTFDGSGKILSLTVHSVNTQSSKTVTYYYTYACHL